VYKRELTYKTNKITSNINYACIKNYNEYTYAQTQFTINSIIQIHALDIGIHYKRALLVVFMFCRVLNKKVITLLLTRLIPFANTTKQVK